MTYFPLYDYHSDPLRILSVRRIKQEGPAVPPEPPDPDERIALGDAELTRLGLGDDREVERLIVRNLPDEGPKEGPR